MFLYTIIITFLFGTYYEIGDTMSLDDQNKEFDICYGSYPNDTFKFSDFNGALNGGNYKVIMVRMNAVWWGPCYSSIEVFDNIILEWQDHPNVGFINEVSDFGQPYSCEQWGNMPDGGASQIFIDQGSDIWSLFNTGNAFPSTAFINHEIQVHDLMNNAGSWSINTRITDMLEHCDSDCDPDPCNGVSEGDVNSDGIINIVDAIFIIQYILGNDISGECLPDVNQDGIVNVSDVVILVDFILD